MDKNITCQEHYSPLPTKEGQGGGSADGLDSFIRETLDRRALLADLDRLIIADVRRQARRAWIRRWARIVAFSFGLPLVLFVFFACAYHYIIDYATSSLTIWVMVLPILALIYSTNHALTTFSPEEV